MHSRRGMETEYERAHILARNTQTHMTQRSWTFGWDEHAYGTPVLIYCNSWKINVLLLNSWDCLARHGMESPAKWEEDNNKKTRKEEEEKETLSIGFRHRAAVCCFTFDCSDSVFVFSPIYARFDNVQKFFARRLHDLCTLHFLFLSPSLSHSFAHTTVRSFVRSIFFPGAFKREKKHRHSSHCLAKLKSIDMCLCTALRCVGREVLEDDMQ